jgi:hypothetical protein
MIGLLKGVYDPVLVFCISGSAALALTGHYGGKMVYVQRHAESAFSSSVQK